ncbi:Uncharacterised protein [Vibrio cholerae]|nr:Uncharacterised protein [Vibrio cholerae]
MMRFCSAIAANSNSTARSIPCNCLNECSALAAFSSCATLLTPRLR